MCACLAGAEYAVWILSSGLLKSWTFIGMFLGLCALFLGIAALIHYVVACEHYATAKGSKKPFESAGIAFLFSLFVSVFFVGLAVAHQSFRIVYFALPFTFALGALPLKCLRDRS